MSKDGEGLRGIFVRMMDQAILHAALEGLEAKEAKLEEQIATVRAMIGGKKKPGPKPKAAADDGEAPVTSKKTKKKRVLSPEASTRIAAAQEKRWAAARKAEA